jgi:hypothetical protein
MSGHVAHDAQVSIMLKAVAHNPELAVRRYPTTDQRRSPRLEVFGMLTGHAASINRGVVMLDISFGGFAVEADHAFEAGSIHKFRITTAAGVATELWVRTAHCRSLDSSSARYLAGFQFLYRNQPRVQAAIERLVDGVTGEISFS